MGTHEDTRTPRQQFDDLFRPPVENVVIFAGRLYDLDGKQLPPHEERILLDALKSN